MHSSVRFLPQIIRNSTFCENTRPIMHKFQQSYIFLEMTTTHIHAYSEFRSERFVFLKTRPRTITLTFTPLIYTAMFQNLLFNNVNIKSFIFGFVYVFESACIKCVYAITHMSDYPLYVKYNQLRSQICLSMHVLKRKLIQTSHNIWLFFFNTYCVVNRTLTC